MPSIAVVDDRKSDRDTIATVLRSTLKVLHEDSRWSVIADAPPTKQQHVVQWMDEHDATVLLTDWRLNEGNKNNRVVNYEADALIGEIRKRRPTFPIYVITGFPSEANEHLQDVEAVFDRSDFTKKIRTVLPQILRSGARRSKEQRDLLAELDVLSRKVAKGNATRKDKQRLDGLQGHFQTESPLITELDSVLSELEAAADRADALQREVAAQLRKSKGKE
jgi:hypothetical protein